MMLDSCPHLDETIKPCISYVKGGMCKRDDLFRCTEYMKNTGQVFLSHSALHDYCHCHRKYYYGNIRGLQLKEPSWQMRQGQRASTILGWLHSSTLSNQEALDKYNAFIMSEIEDSRDPSNPEDVGDLILWAMKALFDVYIELDWHTLKGATEYEFRWNEPEYPAVHGFIDLVVLGSNPSEKTRGLEFKWTGSPQFYGKFNMEDQLMSYFIGAPQLQSFEVRLFVPPIMKFKKNEKMSELFQRTKEDVKRRIVTEHVLSTVYYRNEFNLDDYKARARTVAAEIVRYINMPEFVKHPEYPFYQDKLSCWAPFKCDFMPICEYGVLPENLYKKREPR